MKHLAIKEPQKTSILFVGNLSSDIEAIIGSLKGMAGLELNYRHVVTISDFEAALIKDEWDLILCEFEMPTLSPSISLQLAKTSQPQTPLIFITETASVHDAVDMMRLGARGFVERADHQRLINMVRQEVETRRVSTEFTTAFDMTKNDLETEQRHFHEVLNSMQDAILSVTLQDRRLIFVSASFENIFGHPAERFLEDPEFFRQIVHPDDLSLVVEARDTCLREGFVKFEHRILLPNGQVRWLSRQGWVNFDDNGRPIKVNDLARDITAQKQAAEAIHQREANLYTLFNTINDFLFVLDMQGNIQAINQTVMQRLGYSQEELINQSVLFVHPEARRAEAAQIVADMLQGVRSYCPVPIQTKNGDQIPVETYITQGLWNGQPALFGISKDISDLKMSEEKFAAAFRANPALAGLSRVETGEYVEVNPAFCKKLGFTLDEVIGKKSTDLLHLDEKYRQRIIEKLKKQGYIRDEEGVIFTKDGTPLSVMLSAEMIVMQGEAYNFTTAVDITERKQMEEALRQSEERLRDILRHMQDVVWSVELPSYQITYLNPAIKTIYGRPETDFYEDNTLWSKVIHPDDVARIQVIQNALIQQGFRDSEYRIIRPDGEVRWMHDRAWLVKDEHGQPIRMDGIASDITARKRAEDALHQDEERLKLTLEGIEAGTWEWIIPTGETVFNERWAEILGYTLDELAPVSIQTWYDLVHPDDRGYSNRLLDLHFAHQSPQYECEVRMRHKSGHWVWVWDRGMVLEWTSDGKPLRMFGIHVDITERKRAEAALQESEQRLRLFVEYSPAAIAMLDKNMHYISASRRWLSDYRLGDIDIIGHSHYEIFPEIPDHWKEIHRRCLDGAVEKSAADPFPRADGTLDWVHWEIHPWRDVHGEIGGIILFSEVITVQKEAEEALRESEARYRLLAENIADVVWVLDPNTLNFTFVSPSVELLRGYTPEEVLRQPMDEVITPDSLAVISGALPARLEAFLAGDSTTITRRDEVEQYRKDGSTVWTEVVTKLFKDNTGAVQILGVSRDIAERKQAENALRTSEEQYRSLIESSDAVISVFDENGKVLFVNDIAARQLHLAPKDMLGKTMHEFFPSAVADYQLSAIQEVMKTGTGVVHEAASTILGEKRWYRTSIQPVRDANGIIIAGLINASDINSFKLAEEALRQSEKRYRQMFELHGLPKLNIEPETGCIIDANPAAGQFYGYDIPTLKTLTIFDISLSPQHEVQEKMLKAFSTDMLSCELVHRGVDGQPRNVEVFTGPIEIDGKQMLYLIITDITEKERTKATLQETLDLLEQRVIERTAELEHAKDRIEAIFNHSGDGILLLDVNHGIQQANYAFDAMFGIEPTKYYGTKLSAWIHSDDAPKIDAIILEVAETHQRQYVESWARHVDGRRFDIEIGVAPVNRSDKAVTNLVCIIHDITERKQAEQALRESEERLKMMLQGTRAGTWEWLVQTGETHFNERWAEIIGYTLDELAPITIETWANMAHPDDLATSNDLLSKHFSGESAYYDSEARMKHKDGHWVWVWDRGMVMEWTPDGKPLRMLGTHVDITERKQAEQALRESEERIRTTITAMSEGIVMQDADGAIQVCNKSAEVILGLSTDQMMGRTSVDPRWRSVHEDGSPFPGDTHPAMVTLRTGIAQSNVIMGIHKPDGELTWISINTQPIMRPGEEQPIAVVATFADVTQRKQVDAALKQALAQEKELNELKSRFVSMASHEFRTPLAAILATTETLTIYRNRMDNSQIDARLDKIRHQVTHMKDIMEDVLQLARMQAGRVEFNPWLADLDALCREIIEEFDSQPQYHERIHYDCTKTPIMLDYDTRLMRQVISNLVSNALKYSPPEQTVYISLTRDSNQVIFKVRDKGIGIPPEDLKRLGEPFHRAANVGTLSGTGLGLSISKQAIELHGGTMTPESQVGKGTTITVVIPITTHEADS